jgi:hypothetical protein
MRSGANRLSSGFAVSKTSSQVGGIRIPVGVCGDGQRMGVVMQGFARATPPSVLKHADPHKPPKSSNITLSTLSVSQGPAVHAIDAEIAVVTRVTITARIRLGCP